MPRLIEFFMVEVGAVQMEPPHPYGRQHGSVAFFADGTWFAVRDNGMYGELWVRQASGQWLLFEEDSMDNPRVLAGYNAACDQLTADFES